MTKEYIPYAGGTWYLIPRICKSESRDWWQRSNSHDNDNGLRLMLIEVLSNA